MADESDRRFQLSSGKQTSPLSHSGRLFSRKAEADLFADCGRLVGQQRAAASDDILETGDVRQVVGDVAPHWQPCGIEE